MKKKFLAAILIGLTTLAVLPGARKVSAAGGSLDTTFAPTLGANGTVWAQAVQADGKIIIGGTFNTYNGVARGHIARINTDGTLDLTFATGVGADADISSVTIQSDSKIVITGSFAAYNGAARNRIARLNSDGTLDTTFIVGSGPNNFIYTAVIQSDGKIVIGGNFTTYNGTARGNIARVTATGTLDTTFAAGSGANVAVNSLGIQSDGKIIIGGDFTTYNGTARNYIARVTATGTLDTTFTTNLNGTVTSLVIASSTGNVIVGGTFTTYNSTTRNRILRLTSTGALDSTFATGSGSSAGLNNSVSGIALQADGKAIVGGSFTAVAGVARIGLTRLNTDGSLDTTFAVNPGVDGDVKTVALQSDGKVVIGGGFWLYNNGSRNNIARINADGTLDTTFVTGSGPNAEVDATAIQSDGKIIIGGWFTNYGGTARGYIARLNTDGSLDATFATGSGVSGGGAYTQVNAIVIQPDGKIIIGGMFSSYNGVARGNIARLNTDGTLDTTFATGSGAGVGGSDYVDTVALQTDGKVLIGGAFVTYDGIARSEITRLNTDGTVDTTFVVGSGADNIVEIIAIQNDGKIVIGGTFNSYNGGGGYRLTRLNTDGSRDVTFTTNTTVDYPHAIAFQSDGKIILAGNMAGYGGVARGNIARLNTDGTLDTSFDSSVGANNMVYSAVVQSDGKIVIGGFFTSYNGVDRGYVARLNTDGSLDASFAAGIGADYIVNSMSKQSDGKIIVAGGFQYFDNAHQMYVARIGGDAASIDLKVSGSDGPLAVTYGATTSIAWTGMGVSGCAASGAWSGAKSTSGSEVSSAITATSTFVLGCDVASDTVVVSPGPAPSVSISVASSSIAYGSLAELQWNSSNISGCSVYSLSGGATTTISTNASSTGAGGTPYIANGPITGTTTYSIDCWNSANYHAAIASTTVVVTASPTGGIIASDTPATCTIASGASTCAGAVGWTITGSTNPEVWLMSAGTTTNVRFSTTASAESMAVYSAGPGSYYWSADADGVVLTANYLVAVTCATGSAWSISFGKCVPLPTIAWTANGIATSSPTFGEGDLNTFSYVSTDANTCNYFNPATSTSPAFSATTSLWSNQAYWAPWQAMVVCTNSAGSATSTFSPTIASNGAVATVIDIPEYFYPGENKTVAVRFANTGTKAWSSTGTPDRVCLTPTAFAAGWVTVGSTQCPSNTGTILPGESVTKSLSIKAPAVEGDYPFSVTLREDGLKDTDGVDVNGGNGYYFGQTADAPGDPLAINASGISNPIASVYIRVKNPTLAVVPTTVSFPDTVVGDPATNYALNIWNIGGGSLSSGNTIAGYSAPFSGSTTFATLGAGTSTPVTVSFTPLATTSYSSSLSVNAGTSSVSVPLLGTGIDQFTFMQSILPSAPRATADFTFGDAQGVSGAYRRMFIRNNSVNRSSGSTTLTFTTNGTSSPLFTCVENCSFNDLSPGQSVWSKWWFHPPLLPRDAVPQSFSGSATWNFANTAKTLTGIIRGWALPVRLEFKEQ